MLLMHDPMAAQQNALNESCTQRPLIAHTTGKKEPTQFKYFPVSSVQLTGSAPDKRKQNQQIELGKTLYSAIFT